MNRFSTALQAVGSGQAGAQNQYNMGVGSLGGIQSLFSPLLNQAGLGASAATGAPAQLAMAGAQANMVPYQGVADFLSNSGAFDALGRWIGGKIGGTQTAPSGSSGIMPGEWDWMNTGSPAPFNPGSWDWINAGNGG